MFLNYIYMNISWLMVNVFPLNLMQKIELTYKYTGLRNISLYPAPSPICANRGTTAPATNHYGVTTVSVHYFGSTLNTVPFHFYIPSTVSV